MRLLLTAEELATRLGLTKEQVLEHYRAGRLIGVRPTQRTLRFPAHATVGTTAEPSLPLDAVAEMLGLAPADAWALADAGILPSRRPRGTYDRVVHPRDLEAWNVYAASPFRRWRPRGDRRGATADGFVYFLEASGTTLVKIGESKRADASRLAEIDQHSPIPVRLLAVKPGGEIEEAQLQRRFALGRMRWEWFDVRAPGLREEIAMCRRQFGHPRGLQLPTRYRRIAGG